MFLKESEQEHNFGEIQTQDQLVTLNSPLVFSVTPHSSLLLA